MFCEACGAKLEDHATACSVCGRAIYYLTRFTQEDTRHSAAGDPTSQSRRGGEMDAGSLAHGIEATLKQECRSYQGMDEDSDEEFVWFFDIDDDTCGFISIDSNEEDFKIPTVTIGIRLFNITDFSREDLETLLEKNGDFVYGSLALVTIEDTKVLFIQTRIPLEDFEPSAFGPCVATLKHEASIGLQ